ncbi:amylo-alpha-1,6-glucosidase [Pseudothermotoga sp.]
MKKTLKTRQRLYLESIGKRSCMMGFFGQGWEVWSWPVKLIANLKASVWIPKTMDMHDLTLFTNEIVFRPEIVKISYAHPLFELEERAFAPIDFPGCFLIYDVNASTDLEMIFSFKPELNVMWPGAIGGQYCHWSDSLNGFLISEPTDSFSAIVRSVGAIKYSKEGDHAFSDNLHTFKLHVPRGVNRFVVSIVGGAMGKKACQELLKIEEDLDREVKKSSEHYRNYSSNTLTIETPDEELNEFFEWGKLSMLKGLIKNPNLGEGLIAGVGPSGKSTRAGFAWFFAGDASINSLSMCGFNDLETVKKSLAFYFAFQNEEGRIPHEISQSHGFIDWFNKYKGFAFLHADTTAWFLLACANYILRTADTAFFEEYREKILKALRFYDSMCDETGLIVNYRAGLGALEISDFRRSKYEIYTSGIYLAAMKKLERVFETMGEEEVCRELREKIEKVQTSIEKFFWNEVKGSYFLSINASDQLFPYLTPWPAFAISFGVLDPDRSKRSMRKMLRSNVMTRWGARSIEVCEHYDPINYNLGSVWYFINGFVAKAAHETGYDVEGWQIVKAAVKAFSEENSTHLSELFSGDVFAPVITAVPHQLFSVGPILWSVLEGTFGLEVDAFEKTLRFRPRVPIHWDSFVIDNLKVSDSVLRIEFVRRGKNFEYRFKNFSRKPIKVTFEPKRPPFGEIVAETPFEFVLEDEFSVSYNLQGIDYALEYTNLKFGLSDPRATVLSDVKDENLFQLECENANDSVIYFFCPEGFTVRTEPDLAVSRLDDFLYRAETAGTKSLKIAFRKI